jgi:hypothetical protein
MNKNLVLIHLNPDGNPDMPIPALLKEISRLTTDRIAVVGLPTAAMRKVIDGFIQSGISVELLENYTHADDQRFTLDYNVTAFMSARA